MVGGAGLMQVFDPDLSEFSPIVSCLLGSFSTAPARGQVRQADRVYRPRKRLPRPPGLQTGRSLASILGRDPAAEAQG